MSPSDSSASPLPSDSSPSGDASGSPTPAPGATTFLDSQPTTDGGYDSGPVTFSGKRYLRGISRWCQGMTVSRVQWNVANSVRFSAVVGISDGTTRAYGIAVDMLFYDQDGHQLTPQPIEASVGHPVPVTIPLTGVVTLRLVCSARYVQTNQQTSVYAALGDPVIVEQ